MAYQTIVLIAILLAAIALSVTDATLKNNHNHRGLHHRSASNESASSESTEDLTNNGTVIGSSSELNGTEYINSTRTARAAAARKRLQAKLLAKAGDAAKHWPSVSPTSCIDGWIAYNQSCYYVGLSAKTWDAAQRECAFSGASLWVVTSLLEWKAITQYAIRASYNWIGLSWPVGSATATWTSLAPANFTIPPSAIDTELLPWLVPTGAHGYTPTATCVSLYTVDPAPYVTYRPCSAVSNYICRGPSSESKNTVTTTTVSPFTTTAATPDVIPAPTV